MNMSIWLWLMVMCIEQPRIKRRQQLHEVVLLKLIYAVIVSMSDVPSNRDMEVFLWT